MKSRALFVLATFFVASLGRLLLAALAIALVMPISLAFGQAKRQRADTTFTLEVELLLDREYLSFFEPRIYVVNDPSDAEKVERQKRADENRVPPRITLEIWLNGDRQSGCEFGVQARTKENESLGDKLSDKYVWVTRTGTYDITTLVKKPGWLSSSAKNVIAVRNANFHHAGMSLHMLQALIREQAEEEARAAIQGRKGVKFGFPFLNVTVKRNGVQVVQHRVLVRFAFAKEGKFTREFLDSNFSFPIRK